MSPFKISRSQRVVQEFDQHIGSAEHGAEMEVGDDDHRVIIRYRRVRLFLQKSHANPVSHPFSPWVD
jgi:hypothetical protein